MLSLNERLQRANTLLAPYAVPHEGRLGRLHSEPEDDMRFPFQRDRDRIIHTQAFRRLKGKTQVFVAGTLDHVRTRLTHTVEVAQISRDLARSLRLNEDLAESIALAHDLGHPPFGHAGETALNVWMETQGGHFEHNEQSHRVVNLLAEHSTHFPGLNLHQEILEGLLKHSTHAVSLEAELVNIADEIAYTGHDCDDGIRAELFTAEDLSESPLSNEALTVAAPRGTSLRGAIIHLLVHDLLKNTEHNLLKKKTNTLDDVYKTPKLVGFSETRKKDLSELRTFLWNRMYLHPEVVARNAEGQGMITRLCTAYLVTPPMKVLQLQKKTNSSLPVAIKDYISGMTDGYAITLCSEL